MNSEYLLVISPDTATNEKVINEKKQFAEIFHCPEILYSKPHITLANFVSNQQAETKIVTYLKNKIGGFSPFLLDIDGFGSFPSNNTLYANVKTKSNIVEVVKEVRSGARNIPRKEGESIRFILEPHLTIARQLSHWQFQNGCKEWLHRSFSARFSVSNIWLLGKPQNHVHYNKIALFSLLSDNKGGTQLSLFAD